MGETVGGVPEITTLARTMPASAMSGSWDVASIRVTTTAPRTQRSPRALVMGQMREAFPALALVDLNIISSDHQSAGRSSRIAPVPTKLALLCTKSDGLSPLLLLTLRSAPPLNQGYDDFRFVRTLGRAVKRCPSNMTSNVWVCAVFDQS